MRLMPGLAAGLLVGLAGCAQSGMTGKLAPDFSLKSLQGQSVSLSQFRGNVVLLGFWAVG